jgi:hypothetical protein
LKIQKVTLKDMEIKEVNGEYERHFSNQKTYPAFLTNYALKKGKELGLLESSLFSDLLKLQGLEKLTNANENADIDPAVFDNLDETKMIQMVYLAFTGANPKVQLSLDEFVQKYHYSLDETMELYMNLIMDLMSKDPNAFAAALQKSTNKKPKHGKKFNRHR